jgi:hypothetical protein
MIRTIGARMAMPAWPMLLLAVLLLTACGRPPVPASISYRTSLRAVEPMRVAILPMVPVEGVGHSVHVLDDALAAALRTRGLHEVVLVPAERAGQLLPASAALHSSISTADLLRLRDGLQVDAVLLGRVDQFQGFDPVALGVTVHLISVEDGAVLWSATAHLDAGRTDVQTDLRWWHEHANGDGNPTIGGWRIGLSSPTLFCRYAADRLVETLDHTAPDATAAR